MYSSSSSTTTSSDEGEILSNIKTLQYPKFKHKKNKTVSKSGSSRKASDKAIYHIAWPHEYAGSDDIEYSSLSLPALVRGENYVIHHLEPELYKEKRAEHLTQLMYFSEQFSWSNIVAFHKDILHEIESGRASWNSSFDHVKARRLNQTHPRHYCALYNKGICKKKRRTQKCNGHIRRLLQ